MLGGGAGGDWFCEGEELFAGEFAKVPVAGDAHFGEDDELGTLLCCLFGEGGDGVEIGGDIAGRVIELDGGYFHKKNFP